MRIGFDFRMGGSINAGIGRYIFELLNAVLAHDAEDTFVIFYNIHNVDPADLARLDEFDNVELVPTSIRHYSLMEQLWLPRIIVKHNIELMHFPNFNVPVLYHGPYVVTIHDMVHHKISGHKKSHWLHFQAYKYIIQKAAERAQKIITVTEWSKQEIMSYLKVPEGRIEVIAEAPSLAIQSDQHIDRIKKQFLLTRPYFLFVGTLERKKNVPVLTKAFDLFLEKYQLEMDLVIAGKVDRHYPEIKLQALDIRHRDRLIFTDYVSDKDLAALYQGAYAFVTASLHEGFGLPGVEAMQFGLPLLASNTDVFNEVYDNAAIYFDPMNAEDIAAKMHLLASDTAFYGQMQDKSLKRSTLFSWDDAAKQTLTVYRTA